MPRISPSILSHASRVHKLLPLLLAECRTIEKAKQELRWIMNELTTPRDIHRACAMRSLHYPLQYILGTQPFGPLDIRCKPGVLIPRWETEEWAIDLAHRLPSDTPLNLLDLCTGTGCIPLLLKKVRPNAQVTGVDISSHALSLAKENSKVLGIPVRTEKYDIINQTDSIYPYKIDILTCNPPYIPRSYFNAHTSTSVKLYEPRLALVGNAEFYENLFTQWLSRADSFVYEVGEISQCEYVNNKIKSHQDHSRLWNVGIRYDSNDKPRVVYGFKKSGTSLDMKKIFENYGQMMH